MESEVIGGAEYLQRWHDRHPGATLAVLESLTDGLGRSSYGILAQAVQRQDEPVLDLACGDGHLLELLRPNCFCFGVDWNVAELNAAGRRIRSRAPLIRADASELPIPMGVLGAVVCHYALMLLQPLEVVLAELARVLRPNGLLANVLPASPPDDSPNPFTAMRAAWGEANDTYPVEIPPIQDDRALEPETLPLLLEDAGFSSVQAWTFVASKPMSVEEAIECFLLTYGPDLLPSSGLALFEEVLRSKLSELEGDTGTVMFERSSTLVTARRG